MCERPSLSLENSVGIERAYALVLVPAVLKAVPGWAACVVCELNRESEMDLIGGQQMGWSERWSRGTLFGPARGTQVLSLGGFHEKSKFAVAVGLGSQSTESAERPELLGPSLLYTRKLHGFPLKLAKLRHFEIPNGQDSVAKRGLNKWLKDVGSNPGSS